MAIIKVYYTSFNKVLEAEQYSAYLDTLPKALQTTNAKYLRWQDRHAHLFGKLLLKHAFSDFGYDGATALEHLKYTAYNRPYLNDSIDFNISHSNGIVLCAIGKGVKLGVDVEAISEISLLDFKTVMTAEQWDTIYRSKSSHDTFFKYWTIKESVVKAEGKGLSIPLSKIEIDGVKASYNDTIWHLQNLNLEEGSASYLAANSIPSKVVKKHVNFYA